MVVWFHSTVNGELLKAILGWVFFQHVFWPTRTSEGSEGQSGSCSTNRGSNRGLCPSSGKAWNTAASSSPVFDCVPLQPMTNCTDICWVKINHWTNTVWPSKATFDLWYKRSAVTFRCSEEQRQKKKKPKQMGENFLSTLGGLNPTHDERMVFSLNRNNNMNVILSFISN